MGQTEQMRGRPEAWARYALAALLGAVGSSALASGTGFVIDPSGAGLGMDTTILAGSAFQSFLIPGLVLLAVHGIGGVATSVALVVGARRAELGAGLLAVALLGWMLVQLYVTGLIHWLQPVFVVIGLVELALALRVACVGTRWYAPLRIGSTPHPTHRRGGDGGGGSSMNDPIGVYSRRAAPLRRRMSMEAYDALPPGHMMFGLLELDVTRASQWVDERRAAGERVSLVAVLIYHIAVALSEHPELNVLRNGPRIVTFEDVDVNIPIERATSQGDFPHSLVIRRASTKSPQAIYAEIEAARHAPAVADDAWTERFAHRLQTLVEGPLPS